MELRLRNALTTDARTVQLPHGTEVTTRAERSCEGRIVPAGAVGRVVAHATQDQIDVMIVGVGVVRYARQDLVPRKMGQARYALRRASAWDALSPCIVLCTVVGSRAWGLSHEGSDTDMRGAFVLPFAWHSGLAEPPLDLVSPGGSEGFWEAGKLVRQALRADPNTLETLFVPSARATDPMGQWLLDARDAFVSTEIYGTFGRYAVSQLKKLEQSMRLAEHRAVVLDWLREDPTLALDVVARRLALIGIRATPDVRTAEHLAKQYLKQLYRSMYDQGLIAANDFDSLVAFAKDPAAGSLDLPRELRPKNAYNLVRLLDTAVRWLQTGSAEFVVASPLRETLLAIKQGEVPLDRVLVMAEAMMPQLEAARAKSALPARPDFRQADALLRRIAHEAARRNILATPGPWGTDAPEPPDVQWDEGTSDEATSLGAPPARG